MDSVTILVSVLTILAAVAGAIQFGKKAAATQAEAVAKIAITEAEAEAKIRVAKSEAEAKVTVAQAELTFARESVGTARDQIINRRIEGLEKESALVVVREKEYRDQITALEKQVKGLEEKIDKMSDLLIKSNERGDNEANKAETYGGLLKDANRKLDIQTKQLEDQSRLIKTLIEQKEAAEDKAAAAEEKAGIAPTPNAVHAQDPALTSEPGPPVAEPETTVG